MFTSPENFSAATKANFDTQLAMMTDLTAKLVTGVEKFVELNMAVLKTSVEESTATVKQLLAAKDTQEVFSLSKDFVQPTTEKFLAYTRHLSAIATNTQVEFAKTAETQLTETNRKALTLIDDAVKKSPLHAAKVVTVA